MSISPFEEEDELWGFAVFKKGEKIRMKVGNKVVGTYIDFGEPLEEEKLLHGTSRQLADGKQVYEVDARTLSEYQAAHILITEIFHRYISKEEFAKVAYKHYHFKNNKRNEKLSGYWRGYMTYGEKYPEYMQDKKDGIVLFLYPQRGKLDNSSSITSREWDPEHRPVVGNIEGDYIRFIMDSYEREGHPPAPLPLSFFGKIDLLDQEGEIEGTWDAPVMSKTENGYVEQLYGGTWQVKKGL